MAISRTAALVMMAGGFGTVAFIGHNERAQQVTLQITSENKAAASSSECGGAPDLFLCWAERDAKNYKKVQTAHAKEREVNAKIFLADTDWTKSFGPEGK